MYHALSKRTCATLPVGNCVVLQVTDPSLLNETVVQISEFMTAVPQRHCNRAACPTPTKGVHLLPLYWRNFRSKISSSGFLHWVAHPGMRSDFLIVWMAKLTCYTTTWYVSPRQTSESSYVASFVTRNVQSHLSKTTFSLTARPEPMTRTYFIH